MTFSADEKDKLSKERAQDILDYAAVAGDGGHEKDCFWRGYRYCNSFFIGLNGGLSIWEVDEETMVSYCCEDASRSIEIEG